MLSLWNEREAARYARDPQLGLRVYSSQLLGRTADLVLLGGGNTSVKITEKNIFGETVLDLKKDFQVSKVLKGSSFIRNKTANCSKR